MTYAEELREVSARELARILHCSNERALQVMAQIPEARRTDGRQWRVPLWSVYRYQESLAVEA